MLKNTKEKCWWWFEKRPRKHNDIELYACSLLWLCFDYVLDAKADDVVDVVLLHLLVYIWFD